MAISISTDSHTFLKKVLKPDVYPLYEQILSSGVVFQTSLYAVSASKPPQSSGWQVNLPIGVFSLMKEISTPQAVMAVNMVNEFVCKLHAVVVNPDLPIHDPKGQIPIPPKPVNLGELLKSKAEAKVDTVTGNVSVEPPSYVVVLFTDGNQKVQCIKIIREMSGLSLKDAKDLVDMLTVEAAKIPTVYGSAADATIWVNKFNDYGAKAAVAVNTKAGIKDVIDTYNATTAAPASHHTFDGPTTTEPQAKVSPNKPLSGTVKLVEAQAVGQKVYGSSSGSVYICIAHNPRVKVAARVQGTQISLRVETKNPTKAEQQAINGIVQWKSNYGSSHFEAGSVPVKRVLGAVIYGMGIKFDEVLQPGETVGGH